jgi:hypothetical protein
VGVLLEDEDLLAPGRLLSGGHVNRFHRGQALGEGLDYSPRQGMT